jgi:hypothetical protein
MLNEPIPLLYKYHRFNTHLFSLLLDNYFYMAEHTKLNDLYECRFVFSEKFLEQALMKKLPELKKSWTDKVQVDDETLINQLRPFIKNRTYLRKHFNEQRKSSSFGISSFTKSNKNETLWAYYTEGYSGVCLEFDFNKFPGKKDLYEVIYNNDGIVLNDFDDKSTAIRILHTKKISYRWEEEVRLVAGAGHTKYSFDKPCLRGIYFGYRMTAEDIRNIMLLTKSKGYNKCRFYIMLDDYDRLEIDYKEIFIEDKTTKK